MSDNEVYNHGSSINASYILYSDTDSPIDDFAYTSSGFSVESISIDENDDKRINVTISCIEGYEECSFNLEVEYGNETQKAHLYAAVNEHGIFTSSVSCEAAVNVYYTHAIENGIMTEEDYREILNEQSRQYVTIEEINGIHSITPSANINSTSDTGDTYVSGTLTWIDDNNNTHNLRGVKVSIYDKNETNDYLIGTTYSDNNGNVFFPFANGTSEDPQFDIYLRIYPGDNNVMVKQFANATAETGEIDYYLQSSTINNVATGATISCDTSINMDSNLGRAFQISQAVMTARDYASQFNGSPLVSISVFYPNNNTTTSPNSNTPNSKKCFYSSSKLMISVGGATTPDDFPDVENGLSGYSSWDALMHEYGHHIEHCLELSNSVGGSHDFHLNLSIYNNRGKEAGLKLAWSEALATALGGMAQQYYTSLLSGIHGCGNTIYTAYNGAAINYETLHGSTVYQGEDCEGAVLSIIWDIYDSSNDVGDTVSLGHTLFWDLIKDMSNASAKTLHSFLLIFYSNFPQHTNSLTPLLAQRYIAPRTPIISNNANVSFSTPPIITFDVEHYDVNHLNNYKNNIFNIVIYNNSDEEIFRYNGYSEVPVEGTVTFEIPSYRWTTLMNTMNYREEYYIVIEGLNSSNLNSTSAYITGPYPSLASAVYVKPDPPIINESFTFGSRIYNSRFVDKRAVLDPGQVVEYYITFGRSGNVIIQTFGEKDVVIELCDTDGNLIVKNDDSGAKSNSLISYTVTQDSQYRLRVYFYNKNTIGSVRTALFYYDAIDTFEDFYSVAPGWLATRIDVSLGSVDVIRFKTTVDTTIRFDVVTGFDSCLYIVNTSSTEITSTLNSAESQWNDDANGGSNPSLTMTLKANIEYLIIVSAFDPFSGYGYAGRLNATVVE